MKFSLLLFFLGRKLKSTAKKIPDFKKRLKEKDFTLLIKTEDGKRARHFVFSNGDVSSTGGPVENPHISLIWSDAATGFKTMTARGSSASMEALQAGKLKLEGNAELALWFTETVKQMMKAGKKDKK